MCGLRMNMPASGRLRLLPQAATAWLGLAAGTALAAPPNDNFANPIILQGIFGSTNGDNTGATAQAGEPSHAGLPPKASVWYQWTATEEGTVEFDTFNSSIDTVLAVYTGSALGKLNMVVANDDINTSNPQSFNTSNDPYVKNWYLGPSGVKFNT